MNTYNYYGDSDHQKGKSKSYGENNSENVEKNNRKNTGPLINIANNTMTNSHTFENAIFLAGVNNYLDPTKINNRPNKRSSSEQQSSEKFGMGRQSKEIDASASLEKVNDF